MLEITPLFSGSSGNSLHVRCNDVEILIDAGVSFRNISKALEKIGSSPERIKCIFVTHEHNDHIHGLEVFCKRHGTPVYINSASAQSLCRCAKYPSLERCMCYFEPGADMCVGDMCIKAFRTPHDSFGSVGYRIDSSDGDSFSHVTDIGYVTKCIAGNIFGSATVVFESNHDPEMLRCGPYPQILKSRILSDRGHLSYAACSEFIPHLAANGTKRIILAHISGDNNTPQMALEASKCALCGAGYPDVSIETAPRSILDDKT
ncbi:MAG: MBL fold metallo-hydrolase [Clostridia bacterium]|nr:MBL fold metallo-hydrolase [Clostridia bacterium]